MSAGASRRDALARGWRNFRRWRRSRPFWGGLFTLLAGLEILASGNLSLDNIQLKVGLEGFQAYLIPAILILAGLLTWFTPAQRIFYGVLTVLVSVYSLIGVNFGGFFLGMLLGIIGGSLSAAWAPVRPEPRPAADTQGQPEQTSAQMDEGGQPSFGEPEASQVGDSAETGGNWGGQAPPWGGAMPRRGPRLFTLMIVPLVLTAAAVAALPAAPRALAEPCPTASRGTESLRTTSPSGAAARAEGGADVASARAGSGSDLLSALGSSQALVGGTLLAAAMPHGALPVGTVLSAVGMTASPDPTQTPEPSDTPEPTPEPDPSATVDPTPDPTPSASSPPAEPSPTPSASTSPTTPGQSPTTPGGSPSVGDTPRPPAPPPCPSSTVPEPKMLQAAPDQHPVATLPARMTGTRLSMRDLSFDGIVDLPTADGTIRVLQFSLDRATTTNFELRVPTGDGISTSIKSTRLTVAGDVKFYTNRFTGKLLGLLEVTFTPDSPPSVAVLEIFVNEVDIFFTDVDIQLVYLACDSLTAQHMRM